MCPLLIGFDIDFNKNVFIYSTYRYLSLAIFSIDIIISLNMGYYEQGVIVIDRKKVLINFIKGNFL